MEIFIKPYKSIYFARYFARHDIILLDNIARLILLDNFVR